MLNFIQSTAKYQRPAVDYDLDGEEESDEEEAPPPAKADRVSKARFGKGWRKKAKGWFGGDEEAKDSTTIELGAVSDKVAEEVEELEGEAGAAVSGLETGLESASNQLGDLVREKVIPEFVAGQQKRAKFPTSKAPFSAISTRFG